MDLHGLIPKYPVNRLLTEQERTQQLKQTERLHIAPLYQLCVIKLNSTYLESVDKWFAWKGVLTAVTLAFMTVVIAAWLGVLYLLLQDSADMFRGQPRGEMVMHGILQLGVISLVVWALTWILRKESFAYTHYPMRFDRKARMVHVFRPNGTTLSVPWDHIFFTLGFMAQWREWEVRGHVLKEDGLTVEETFALSYIGTYDTSSPSAEPNSVAPDDYLRAHWEFVRRYMEEGPQAVIDQVQFCMPVADHKEGLNHGLERVCANIASAPFFLHWMLWPVCMLIGLVRAISMATCKVPRFPDAVEAMSRIEPDDPYAIQADLHGERIAVYPAAAAAPGVCFKDDPKHVSRSSDDV